MSVASARKTNELALASNPKEALFEALGDLSGFHIFHNQILIAVYVRPEVTKGGIIRPGTNVKEDEYQGKVGLVVKKGCSAFQSTGDEEFGEDDVEVGDWVVFRVGDGWQLTIRDVACRILTDRTVRMRIENPLDIF